MESLIIFYFIFKIQQCKQKQEWKLSFMMILQLRCVHPSAILLLDWLYYSMGCSWLHIRIHSPLTHSRMHQYWKYFFCPTYYVTLYYPLHLSHYDQQWRRCMYALLNILWVWVKLFLWFIRGWEELLRLIMWICESKLQYITIGNLQTSLLTNSKMNMIEKIISITYIMISLFHPLPSPWYLTFCESPHLSNF